MNYLHALDSLGVTETVRSNAGALRTGIQRDALSTAALTALNVALTVSVEDEASGALELNGTFTGTISFEASVDSTNGTDGTWRAITAITSAGSSLTNSATAAGAWYIPLSGFRWFRARCSAYTSGTMNAAFSASVVPYSPSTVSINGSPTVIPSPSATSGAIASQHHKVAAASTNATNVKASQGNLGYVHISNPSAAVKYVKFFNKATAPTVGTDTPNLTILVPAGQSLERNFGSMGLRAFSAGIGYAITGAAADLDTTAVAAGDVILDVFYT